MDNNIKKEVMERYDETSRAKIRSYLDPIQRYYYKNLFIDFAIRSISADLDDGDRILDIGTGAGLFPHHLADSGYNIYGIDFAGEAVQAAREYAGNPDASYLRADGEELCFDNDIFDGVSALGVFEYVDDINPFLTEISRVSKGGSPFVLTLFNENTYSSKGRTSSIPTARYTIEEITERLSEHEFTVESYQTSYFVSQYQKLLAFSERVPDSIRWISVFGAIGFNNLCQQIPILKERGEMILVYARYDP